MAHPKRKISKTRRDKRRTHYKAERCLRLQRVLQQEKRTFIIELIGMKENFITEGKCLIDNTEAEENKA